MGLPESVVKLVAVSVVGLYAVFEHRGPLDQIVETVNYAWASWLPSWTWCWLPACLSGVMPAFFTTQR